MRRQSHAQTDIGLKRRINQDSYLKNDELGLYIVADGMGGHRGGEVASRLAVECMQKYCMEHPTESPHDRLSRGINLSCQEIYKQSQENEELSGMGTTVMALLVHEGVAYFGQVGDSRAYLLHKNEIWQITEDHSLLNEEIRAGRISQAEASSYQFRNVITRSVGYESKVVVDIYRREISPGDIFFLCTDGLSGLVEIHEILEEINRNGCDTGLKRLINLANDRGGDDNITALVCQMSSD